MEIKCVFYFFRSVPDRYVEKLIKSNILTKAKKENIVKEHSKWLSEALKQVENYVPEASYFLGKWTGMKQAEHNITQWDTGIDIDLLRFIGKRSVHIETNFVSIYINKIFIYCLLQIIF